MIEESRVKEILFFPAVAEGLKKYQFIMKRVQKTDVSSDVEFQTVYRNFYQMRRFYSDAFAKRYFDLMEQMKNWNSVSFRAIFKRVKLFQYTYELSFSSKLLHTLRPEWPIWDKIVGVDHFHYRAPSSKRSDVDVVFTERYEQYADTFGKYLASSEGHMLIKNFDERFPENGISDMKKAVFVLWQDRVAFEKRKNECK